MLALDPQCEPRRRPRHVSEILGELPEACEARSRARQPQAPERGRFLLFHPVARQNAVPLKGRA